jgi:hypothetical protein
MSEIGRWFFEHISDNASSYFLDSFFNLFFIEAAEGFNRTSVSLTGLFIHSFHCIKVVLRLPTLVKIVRVTGLNYFFTVFTVALVAIRGVWD